MFFNSRFLLTFIALLGLFQSPLVYAQQESTSKRSPYAAYGAGLGYSFTSYVYEQNSNYPAMDKTVDVQGVDINTYSRFSEYFGIEASVYLGYTSDITLGGDTENTAPLSDYTDMKNVKLVGTRVLFLFGRKIISPGFRISTGVGAFAEQTTIERVQDFTRVEVLSGIIGKFAIGYGWQRIGTEFWVNVRSGKLSGFHNGSTQGGLTLNYRFSQ